MNNENNEEREALSRALLDTTNELIANGGDEKAHAALGKNLVGLANALSEIDKHNSEIELKARELAMKERELDIREEEIKVEKKKSIIGIIKDVALGVLSAAVTIGGMKYMVEEYGKKAEDDVPDKMFTTYVQKKLK